MQPISFREKDGRKFKGFFVIFEPHWRPPYKGVVVRITKFWIIVRCNEVATCKYSRKDGYTPGAFRERTNLTPTRISKQFMPTLNNFADQNGGTWDGGWKPAKRDKR